MKTDFLQINVSPLHIVMLLPKSRMSSTNISRVGMGGTAHTWRKYLLSKL